MEPKGIVPVFVQQVMCAEEGNFQMWGMTFNMVTIVGIVRHMETSSTKITYTLEDHTGQIEAHYWLEEDNPSKSPDVMVNCYARIYGSLRQHSGKKTVMIFRMFSLSGANELTTHLLEVYTARYKAERLSQKRPSDFMPMHQEHTDNSNTAGLTPHQSAVLQAIRNYMDTESGISMTQLHKSLSYIPGNELREIIEFLVTEGIIYTSIDAEHFLST
ncbi:replication protein A 32 kDa subunit isoform X2 [Hermetia illucens]|uniref:replication protein A 32 kDa subunit isoform X2 n=1 Tax=Hermetia illucens TaxID=343691 RepID=UPI0018CC5A59|nr:replication protein A 32 kDa subunit isoform X2 [Hermetia illucens]